MNLQICAIVCLLVLISLVTADDIKIGILNDLHYEPYYEKGAPIERNCRRADNPIDILSLLEKEGDGYGQYGCDAPKQLVNAILDKMNEIDPDVDVILVSGDFVSHGYSVELFEHDHYELVKKVIEEVMLDLIAAKFPKAVILPSVGNNDIKYHYVAPQKNVSATDYYPFLYNITFNMIEANRKVKAQGDIEEPFKRFGGFRYDHSDTLTFISFNSLYYNDRTPSNDTEIKWHQMEWLAKILENAEPDRKFVIFFHIYPGIYFIGKVRFFWESPAVVLFNSIIQRNLDKIALITGAHSHFPDIKVYFEREFTVTQLMAKDIEPKAMMPRYAMLVTPSVSPVFNNNPGFTLLTLDGQKATDITWHFMELWKIEDETYVPPSEIPYNSLNFAKDLNIPEFTPHFALRFIRSLKHNKERLFVYLAQKIGFRGNKMLQALSEYVKLNMINMADDTEYFCSCLNMLRVDYYYCLQEGRQMIRVKR